MKIIEHFTQGKTGQESLNEDCLIITDDFIAVLDGVTSKSCPKIDGKAGGRFAVDVAAPVISAFKPDIEARAAVNQLTKVLHETVVKKTQLPDDVEFPAFAMIIYSRARKQVWRVADPILMLDGKVYHNEIELDKITSATRAFMIEMALQNGMTNSDILANDVGREFIKSMLKDQHVFANKAGPYGYGVINGSLVPDEFLEVFEVGAAREIVFSTDGYPVLFATLKESEDYLAKVLKEDPLLFRKHKSTKGLQPGFVSFDDRTYVSFLAQ